jgi:hypothetical protein
VIILQIDPNQWSGQTGVAQTHSRPLDGKTTTARSALLKYLLTRNHSKRQTYSPIELIYNNKRNFGVSSIYRKDEKIEFDFVVAINQSGHHDHLFQNFLASSLERNFTLLLSLVCHCE